MTVLRTLALLLAALSRATPKQAKEPKLRDSKIFRHMKVVSIFSLLFLVSIKLTAQEQTFVKEFTYKASEMDSKHSCRTIAINQLRSILLNEIGIYVESESILRTSDVSGKFAQDFIENIATISAGITKLEILQETWNGETFWMKASITIDKKNLEESLRQLVQDRQKLKELEGTKQQLTDAIKEIDKLKNEIKTLNKKSDSTLRNINISKYNKEINKLDAANYTLTGYNNILNRDYKAAIENYTKAINLDPENWEAFQGRGVAKASIENDTEAMGDFTKAIEINPLDGYSYYCRGRLNYANYKEAIQDFTRAIDIDSNNEYSYCVDAFCYRARLKTLGLDDYSGAIEDYTKAIELDPNRSDSYYKRGSLFSTLKNYEDAINDYTKAIELDPQVVYAYQERGAAKIALENFIGAIADYTKVIELDPKNQGAYRVRGYLKANLEDFRGSIADFTSAVKINPTDAQSYFNRGLSKNYINELQGALADYSKAIEIDPKDAQSYFRRGLLVIKLGRSKNGCLDLSKAGELGYEDSYEAIKKYCH
jgi:tetratricopeptide (TPR) repeat protein